MIKRLGLAYSLSVCVLLAVANCKSANSNQLPTVSMTSSGQEKSIPPLSNKHEVPMNQWQKVFSVRDAFASISFGDDIGLATGYDEYFWLTKDGGKTWNKQRLNREYGIDGKKLLTKAGGYDLVNSAVTASGCFYTVGHLEEVGSAIFWSCDRGASWKVNLHHASSLNDIEVIGDTAWVAGNIESRAAVLRAEGIDSWKVIWTGRPDQSLNGVHFMNASIGWVVGAKGLILNTSDGGISWHPQPCPVQQALESVAVANDMSGYVVGERGTILHTSDGGTTWTRQSSGIEQNLTKVVAVDANVAWAVGWQGTVLYTADGGRNWRSQDIGSKADIYSLTLRGNEIWIATSDGIILRSPKILLD